MTYLLSYPRSGNTWTRYIIEAVFNIPTYGDSEKTAGTLLTINKPDHIYNDGAVHKRHHSVETNSGDLIYIERTMHEAVNRHTSSYNYDGDKSEEVKLWLQNKQIYDSWQGNKVKIEYQDLIDNPELVIDKLSTVLGEPIEKDYFLAHLDEYVQESVNLYTEIQGAESFTYGIRYDSSKG